jgi:hypothetical protein
LRQRPEVKRLTEQAVAKLDQLSGQAADKLQAARQSTGTEAGSSGGQPSTVVPETPTVTPPSPTRDAACGSGPDASRADRPARRGRFGC